MNPAVLAAVSKPRRRRVPPGDPLKVVAYLRASTGRQELGIEAQRRAIAAWCRAQGAALVETFEEPATSGATPLENRPQLLAALQALRTHGAGVLTVARRDRMARDVVTAAVCERMAEQAGARILSADGQENGDSPDHALLRSIKDALAVYERALLAARTRAALAVKRARGERCGQIPYGKRLASDGVRLVPDPAELRIIRTARRLRANGHALRAIAARLDAKGFKPRGSGRWHPQSVSNLLA